MQKVNRVLLCPDNVHIVLVRDEDMAGMEHVTEVCGKTVIQRIIARGLPENLPVHIESNGSDESVALHPVAAQLYSAMAVTPAPAPAPVTLPKTREHLYQLPGSREEYLQWMTWLQTPDVINKLF
jgi:hypothetical protein